MSEPSKEGKRRCSAYSAALAGQCDLEHGHDGLHDSAGDGFHFSGPLFSREELAAFAAQRVAEAVQSEQSRCLNDIDASEGDVDYAKHLIRARSKP